VPVTAGLKVMETEHFAPAFSFSPQSLVCEKSIPEIKTPRKATDVGPEFVSVKV
jgi:hypothetical protein